VPSSSADAGRRPRFLRTARVNPKFHSGRRSARRRRAIVIWRLPTREGSDIYLYLMIEFRARATGGWPCARRLSRMLCSR